MSHKSDNRAIVLIHSKEQGGKTLENNSEGLRDMYKNIKSSILHIPGEKRKNLEQKKYLKKIMAKIFPNLFLKITNWVLANQRKVYLRGFPVPQVKSLEVTTLSQQ